MINFYSGTPGSGKSLHLAEVITNYISLGVNVIGNIPINIEEIRSKEDLLKRKSKKKKKQYGRYYYFRNKYITPELFMNYARKFHVRGKECQTLIILDEAQMLYSPSVVKLSCQDNRNFRVAWLDFFTQHRHFGFDIIMISQFDKLIDPQIRVLFEYNCIHRKANNMGGIIPFFVRLSRMKMFVCVKYWYGTNHRVSSRFYFYKKKYSRIYDSFGRFDTEPQKIK